MNVVNWRTSLAVSLSSPEKNPFYVPLLFFKLCSSSPQFNERICSAPESSALVSYWANESNSRLNVWDYVGYPWPHWHWDYIWSQKDTKLKYKHKLSCNFYFLYDSSATASSMFSAGQPGHMLMCGGWHVQRKMLSWFKAALSTAPPNRKDMKLQGINQYRDDMRL